MPDKTTNANKPGESRTGPPSLKTQSQVEVICARIRCNPATGL